jgi:hypothetical protein
VETASAALQPQARTAYNAGTVISDADTGEYRADFATVESVMAALSLAQVFSFQLRRI